MTTPLEQAKLLQKQYKDNGSIEAEHKLAEYLSEYEGEDKIILSTDITDEIKKLENEERYYTGIKKLDTITDGFRSNQIIAISAPPKAGKTQFCVHIAKNLPNPTLFLFEESPAEVLYKYHQKGLPLPRFYTTNSRPTDGIDFVYRKMIEAWTKYDSKIFFIDHLHYLLDDTSKNTGDKIKNVMEQLKDMCKRHGFTVFLIAHMTKGNFDEPPGIEAIRDSSFIPQYADTTMILWRETVKGGASEHKNVRLQTSNLLINVALNRKINFESEFNTGLVDLTFDVEKWDYKETNWYTEWIEEGVQKDNVINKIYGNIEE
jgi:predicted ATP-dependent serine protease